VAFRPRLAAGLALFISLAMIIPGTYPNRFYGFSNNIFKLALGRLIPTLPHLHQFSKNIDYCAISGRLMNLLSGE
jgi:hypothetical protein